MNLPFVAVSSLTGLAVILVSLHLNNREESPFWTRVGTIVTLVLFLPVKLSFKIFTKLGANMTAVDEAIARFTSFTEGVLTDLKAAQSRIQELIDTDASEDAAQRDEILNDVAGQINSAVDKLENPPVPDPETGTETPAPETAPGTVEEAPEQQFQKKLRG